MRRMMVSILTLMTALLGAQSMEGNASWYGPGFHGKLTANGETFNMWALTAAHRSLPFGTYLEVTNTSNGKTIRVRVNDRGPFVDDRILDVSRAAAQQLDMIESGVAPVRIRIVDSQEPESPEPQQDPVDPVVPESNHQTENESRDLPENAVYIQIGAFSNIENARGVYTMAREMGLNAAVYAENELHRVFVITVPRERFDLLMRLESETNWTYLVKQLPPQGSRVLP